MLKAGVAFEPDFGVAVIEEGVAAHQVGEPFGGHVVAHVGIADSGRDADGAADRGHQTRLVHAISVPCDQGGAGAIGLALHRRVVGVVAQIVAHGVIEAHRLRAVAALARDAPCIVRDFRVL
jgi:hypothetical protein